MRPRSFGVRMTLKKNKNRLSLNTRHIKKRTRPYNIKRVQNKKDIYSTKSKPTEKKTKQTKKTLPGNIEIES